MSHLPHHLAMQAAASGNISDQALVALVKTVEKQNAILDDTIHGELKRLADSQESIAESLNAIVRHFVTGV